MRMLLDGLEAFSKDRFVLFANSSSFLDNHGKKCLYSLKWLFSEDLETESMDESGFHGHFNCLPCEIA